MDEVLTWEEIEQRFDGEWVAIADPEVTDDLEILGGRVVYHGADYDAAYTRLAALGVFHGAVEFLGPATIDGIPMIL